MDVMGMGVRLISNPFFWKYDVSEAGVGGGGGAYKARDEFRKSRRAQRALRASQDCPSIGPYMPLRRPQLSSQPTDDLRDGKADHVIEISFDLVDKDTAVSPLDAIAPALSIGSPVST